MTGKIQFHEEQDLEDNVTNCKGDFNKNDLVLELNDLESVIELGAIILDGL
jgi:hypothetical protein